jgi:hypothetical protein
MPVKLHDEVVPGAQYMCIGGYKYIGPHLLLSNTLRAPARSGGEDRPLGMAAGPVLLAKKLICGNPRELLPKNRD